MDIYACQKICKFCITRRFACGNICDLLKLVLRLHCALPDVTKYAAGNVYEFLGFMKFANISTSRTFPLIHNKYHSVKFQLDSVKEAVNERH